MNINELIQQDVAVTHSYKTVQILIHGSQESLTLLNTIIMSTLQVLKSDEMVKDIINKEDVLILIPQRGITMQELIVDVKRLVYGAQGGSVEVGAGL